MNSSKFETFVPPELEIVRSSIRKAEVGFAQERARYDEALREAYARGPVSGYEQEFHVTQWPVDMSNELAHITCYYFETNYSAQAVESEHSIHEAVDVQVPRDTEVFAPSDVSIVGYSIDHHRKWLSDIYLYDDEAELLYILAHLNPSSVLKSIQDNLGFPRISKVRLNRGEPLGKVGRFFTPESAMPPRVVVPPDVLQQYGRTYDHVHIQTHPLKRADLDTVNGFFEGVAVNPLLVFEKVY